MWTRRETITLCAFLAFICLSAGMVAVGLARPSGKETPSPPRGEMAAELTWTTIHEGVVCKKYQDGDCLVIGFYDGAYFPIPLHKLGFRKCRPGWVGRLQEYGGQQYRLVPTAQRLMEKG